MSATEDRDRPSRVEREILEILERSEERQTPVEAIHAAVRRQQAPTRAPNVFSSHHESWAARLGSPEIIRLGGALLLALVAVALAGLSSLLGTLLAIASAVVFFSLWFPSRTPGIQQASRWRGQDLGPTGSPRPFWRDRKPPL